MRKEDPRLHYRSSYGKGPYLDIDITRNWKYRHCSISLGRGGQSLKFSLSIPFVISFYFKIGSVLPQGKSREISLSFHGGSLRWVVWRDTMDGWSKAIPFWRDGYFNFADFFLGKSRCEHRIVEQRALVIPMPEKSYQAHAKLVEYSWLRPRWFTRHMMRCEIEVPEGIPHEGKGENSWDCGTDATFGITTGECHSITQGVGILVGSVLGSRIKYGGWGDYHWSKIPRS